MFPMSKFKKHPLRFTITAMIKRGRRALRSQLLTNKLTCVLHDTQQSATPALGKSTKAGPSLPYLTQNFCQMNC